MKCHQSSGCRQPQRFVFHHCASLLFAAWCLPPHCAVHCSHRRGEWKPTRSISEPRTCTLVISPSLQPPHSSRKCYVTSIKRDFLTPFTSAAPYQSAAWNQNCRRKSGPATQGWSGSTSTKGFERRGPSPHPNTLPPHGHRRGPRCQPSSLIQCAKVKSVSPPHVQQSGRCPGQSVALLLMWLLFYFWRIVIDWRISVTWPRREVFQLC